MNQLAPLLGPTLPVLMAAAGERAQMRFLEFFTANIRNPHTRRAYARSATDFLDWCATRAGLTSLAAVQPVHVAAYIEGMNLRMKSDGTPDPLSTPTIKQNLAAIRHLFDWLVVGQIVPVNPAASVRARQHRRCHPRRAAHRSGQPAHCA